LADTSPKSRPATYLDEPGPLEVVVNIDGTTAFVRISGELDMGTESSLREGLIPYAGQYAAVVYELDSLSFIDVAGLRCLDTAPGIDNPITIRDPSRQVRRLLDLAGRESLIDTTTKP
jgi:anti-anti-sigma factor